MSLFRRVTRYSRHHGVNPRENRLTEVFAAVLEEVDGLAQGLVAEWLGVDVEGERVRVTTQLPTPRGFFVDVELSFGAAMDPRHVVWIENKHGAALSPGQAEKYVDELAARYGSLGNVVLVAPRATMPESPRGVPPVRWDEVTRSIEVFRRAPGRSSVERWLLDELIHYLEEEGLATEQPLDAACAFALSARPASERTISRLAEFVDRYLADNWAPRSDGRQRGLYAVPFYAHYPIVPGGGASGEEWESIWFEFTLREDGSREDDARDALVFAAGATLDTSAARRLSAPEYSGWLAARGADGFEHRRDDYWRLWRYCYPEELLAKSSLEEQGFLLGKWVASAFRDLSENPPVAHAD